MIASHCIRSVFAACGLLAAPASAQTVAVQAGPERQTPAGHHAASPLAPTASTGLKLSTALRRTATPQATTTVTAAGSQLLLADGSVADKRTAQVQPPAPGFQYER